MENKKNKFTDLSEALKDRNKPHPNTIENDQQSFEPKKSIQKQQGKRSNPDYEQVGAYIPKHLHKEVKKILLDYDTMDFSDLLSILLKEWISNKHK